MTRTAEIPWLSPFIRTFLHSIGALIGGNTRCSIHMINRYRKSCFMVICVLRHHSAKLQLIHNLACCRHTDKAAGFLSHKVYSLRCAQFSSHNQVAFVFAILVISYQHHFARLNGGKRFINCIVLKISHKWKLLYILHKSIFQQTFRS